MLIDVAWRTLQCAREGNKISINHFNGWAASNNMPLYPNSEYDNIKDYEGFYQLCYYHIFGG